MSARDELYELVEAIFDDVGIVYDAVTDAFLAAGYRKPRTITTAEELDWLAAGSVIRTSKESDTMLRKVKGASFRDQSGYELSATDLWRYGTHPMTVLYEPTA